MKHLIFAINKVLNEDEQLTNLVSAVRYWRAPTEPEKLIKPVVVFEFIDFTDKESGLGVNVLAALEFNIYGYDNDSRMIQDATLAADRVKNLLTTKRLDIEGNGGAARMKMNMGWQTVHNNRDPKSFRLQSRLFCSYWSPSALEEYIND